MKLVPALTSLIFSSLILVPFSSAQETKLTGCAAKRQDLTQQIEQARASGNSPQQAGLEKALKENQAHCTDASLLKERQNKVKQSQREVTKREADLQKAEVKGDSEKMEQRRAKLDDARKELDSAQAELNR